MKFLPIFLILITSVETFARDHREDRGRAERAEENRRRNEQRRRDQEVGRRGNVLDIFDISNSATLTTWTFEEKQIAGQIINDSQDYIQTGVLTVLLQSKINEVQVIDQELSLEDALDLIVSEAQTKL